MSGVQQLVRNVRDALARRGTDNIWALGRAFRIADDDRSGFLTYPEFTKSLREVGIDLPDTQARQLFSAFDRTGNGQVEYDEFLQQIRGRMNSARLAVVAKAFAKLDHMKRGVVTVDDIAQLYNARAHPEVKQGKSTEDMVFRRFLEQFDTVTQDGQVHLNEFEEYYQNVSASIDRDDYFIELVTNAWQLNRGAVAGAAAQATATSPYKATIRPPFATDIPQTPAAQATRGSRGMPTTAATAQQAATPPWNADVQQVGAAQPGVRNVDQTVELLRNVLAARGVRGIFSLGKLFRIVDNDNSRDLTQAEFSQAMREFRVGLTDVEVGKLFQAFDRNQSGTIDYNEFLRALRGPLPPIRKAIINRAFRSMDTSGNGTIDMSDLRGVYTPRLHPDVRAGKRTEDDVLLEFLDTFGAAGGREITSEQFEEYYANVSASIDDDKYFELMMTNAWRLSDAPVQQRSPQQSQQLRTVRLPVESSCSMLRLPDTFYRLVTKPAHLARQHHRRLRCHLWICKTKCAKYWHDAVQIRWQALANRSVLLMITAVAACNRTSSPRPCDSTALH
eukprot:TRINITY_DN1614_c0_g1_i1.p1 TRINITY_DN1614_c0_g1~~TRINITY_DN1614_c0_g1_i1.p1  ORF type:complete len:561 (-),score=121.51 TRINITY_DN1614_c0_g1_i1:504-2186(-)